MVWYTSRSLFAWFLPQETLLPEKKAIYLSILDAALNGPFYIQTEDAMAVFGVRAV